MAGPNPVHSLLRTFLHALRDLGYVEGRNLILERRSAEGNFERLGEIVSELVSLRTDVIVCINTMVVQRAHAVTRTIPIVQLTGTDPAVIGLASSVSHPGGNVTGMTSTPSPEVEAKRLELLKQIAPGATRIAFLGMKSDWEAPWGQSVRRAAQALGIALVLTEHQPTDYTGAFALIERSRMGAIFLAANPPNWQYRRVIADFSKRTRLPSAYMTREYPEAGGLLSYGYDVRENCRGVAQYVDKILKGAKAGDLPIEHPSKYELIINSKTAVAIGLSISQELLLRADQVIE
jgi:putative ABC transport system substrate-binding protein